MTSSTPSIDFHFSNRRLRLSWPSHLLVRIIIYTAHPLLIALSLTFLISDLKSLNWLGLGLALFLLDKLIHLRSGRSNLLLVRSGQLNSSDFLTPAATRLLERSLDQQSLTGQDLYLLLFYKIISLPKFKNFLSRLEVDPSDFLTHLLSIIDQSPQTPATSSDLANLINQAGRLALMHRQPYIDLPELCLALLSNPTADISRSLSSYSLSPDDFKKIIIWYRIKNQLHLTRQVPATLGGFSYHSRHYEPRIMNRAWTARPTPTLDSHSLDLTTLARQETIGFLIGHQTAYLSLENILSKPDHPNLLLVGQPGIGKKSLLAHLAFRIIKDQVPSPLFDQRLVSLDLSSLTAGLDEQSSTGLLQKIVAEIMQAKNIILVINNLDRLFDTSVSTNKLADTLLPLINQSSLSVIGLITPANFKKISASAGNLLDNFSTINIEAVSLDEAELILTYLAVILENRYRNRLKITVPAIKTAVSVANKYLGSTPLPGSAIKLLEETSAACANNSKFTVQTDNVITTAEHKVNVPIHKTSSAESQDLINLEEKIHERFIDQVEAVQAVASSLRQYRSGLSKAGRPIASFLFLGPTGVGKTELAKIIADLEFGSSRFLIRLDMSEYQNQTSLSRLLGSADSNLPGALTEAVLNQPYSLILLDEFEKAHPDILNVFLQVLDDGRLTDSFNQTVKFDNTIIIATSNAYSAELTAELRRGESMSSLSRHLKSNLTKFFKPELLNRFSKIIAFRELSPSDLLEVAKLKLSDLTSDLISARSIKLNFTPAAVSAISRLGYDPAFGARPLTTAINDYLKNPLAEKILRSDIKSGQTITVDYPSEGQSFTFTSDS